MLYKNVKEKHMELIHNVIIENREKLSLSGVTDVDNFDDGEVLIYTSMGDLSIRGKNLKVEAVSVETGELKLTGQIKALVWGDKDRTKKLGILGKILR